MKLHKHFLFCLLAVTVALLCLVALPQTAHAASTSDLTFKLNSDGNGYTVSDCKTAASGELVIPATYNGKPVTGIGWMAFYNCASLTSITIPDSVTYIGELAFVGCDNLSSSTVCDNVKYLGSNRNPYMYLLGVTTKELSTYNIHPDVKWIGEGAFYECANLTSINIPYGVTAIYEDAFYASGLTSVTIPDSVTYLGQHSFSRCTSLASATLPEGIALGPYVFYECTSLNNITLPKGIGWCEGAFYGCSSLTDISIPYGVTYIATQLFLDCSELVSITIPNSVKSISSDAFYGCNNLSKVIFCGTREEWDAIADPGVNEPLFNAVLQLHNYENDTCTICQHYNGLLTFTLNATGDGYTVSDCDGSATGELVIPATYNGKPVTSIGSNAFFLCTGLSGITIPDSVTNIEDYSFSSCSGLISLRVMDGNSVYHSAGNCIIKTASKRLIAGCQTSQIPSDGSVTSIGGSAFSGCSSLTSITIPDSVTSIGDGAFHRCSGLASITIPDSVSSIGYSAFLSCTSLADVTIGNGVTNIGYSTFSNCTSLTRVIIGNSVTKIGNNAFEGCVSLTNITIPDNVTSLGNAVFRECSGLTSLAIPDSVTSISDQLLFKCTNLTSITIPDSVTSIGYQAFYKCTNLTNIVIPDSVTSVGDYALNNCSGLTCVTYCGTQEQWEAMEQGSGNEPLLNAELQFHNYENGACTICGTICGDVVTTSPLTFSLNSDGTSYSVTYCDGYARGELVIPATYNGKPVTGIGDDAFSYCGLTSVTIPNSVTSIGNGAFYGCSSLTSITIPSGVTSIGNYAFEYCTSLSVVAIPNSVTTIGTNAFLCCNLSSVIYCGTPEQWDAIDKGGYYTMEGSPDDFGFYEYPIEDPITDDILRFHNYENGVCTICGHVNSPLTFTLNDAGDGYIVSACDTSATGELVIPGTYNGLPVTSIGGPVFSVCTKLTSIAIPASVTRIDYDAFPLVSRQFLTVIYCGTPEEWDAACYWDDDPIDIVIEPWAITLQFHNYENGVCTICGHKNEDVILPQAATVSVSVPSGTVYRGDTFDVIVSATAIEHCSTGGFLFAYDTSVFEYVSGKALVSGFSAAGVSTANGQVAGYFMGGDALVQGDIFQITLRVKDSAQFTDYTISGTPNFGIKVDGVTENISCATNNATIQVACKHSYGDWIAIDETWRKHICTICSHEETAYIEYTVTFQYADGTVIASAQYHYGDGVAIPDAPPAQSPNHTFIGWDREIEICTGDAVYTALFAKYVPGDMDGNGVTTLDDAVYLLLNSLFGEEFYPLSYAPADVDGSGAVDADDAIYLLLHLMFGEAYYPLKQN